MIHIGSLGSMPISYERAYSDYTVRGDTLAARIASANAVMRGCTPTTGVSVTVSTAMRTPTRCRFVPSIRSATRAP